MFLMRSSDFNLVTTAFLLIQLYLKEQKFKNFKEKLAEREDKRVRKLEKTMIIFNKKMKSLEKKMKRLEKKKTKIVKVAVKQREFVILPFFSLTIYFYTATFLNCILNDARIISVRSNCYYYQQVKNGKLCFFHFC
jgi:Flp pilus assembly protein TadB